MRRRALLALALALAPAAMRLVLASMDLPAVLCLMECHHGATVTGAACCPMAGVSLAGLEFRCCSHAADFVGAPLGHTPMLVPLATRLSLPHRSAAVAVPASPDLGAAFLRLPDKVPLRAC